MVSVAVSQKGDSKRGDFRISSVRCHICHDSAVCLCLGCLQPHSDQLFVCVLVCGCSDFSCCGVVMAYLSFCLFGSTELLDSSWKSKKSCPHSCCNTVVVSTTVSLKSATKGLHWTKSNNCHGINNSKFFIFIPQKEELF